MNNKKLITVFSCFAIFLLVFNIVLFVVRKEFNGAFWVSYVFITLSILLACGCVCFAGMEHNAKHVSSLPVNVLGIMYMAVEFVLGIILLSVPRVSFAGAFIPQLILFAIFLVIAIPAFLYGYRKDDININVQNEDEK